MLLSKQLILVFSLKYQRKKIWFEKVFKSQKNTVQTFLAPLSLISHFEDFPILGPSSIPLDHTVHWMEQTDSAGSERASIITRFDPISSTLVRRVPENLLTKAIQHDLMDTKTDTQLRDRSTNTIPRALFVEEDSIGSIFEKCTWRLPLFFSLLVGRLSQRKAAESLLLLKKKSPFPPSYVFVVFAENDHIDLKEEHICQESTLSSPTIKITAFSSTFLVVLSKSIDHRK